jgi:hypothetical protein
MRPPLHYFFLKPQTPVENSRFPAQLRAFLIARAGATRTAAPVLLDASWGKPEMKNCNRAVFLLAAFAVLALVAAPTVASARMEDKANNGYCKSETKVGDMAKCKENGGTK